MIEHVRYLELPQIPEHLLSYFKAESKLFPNMPSPFYKTNEFCEPINRWCQENICSSVTFGAQIMDGRVERHKDRGSSFAPDCKLVYLVEKGSSLVFTHFWDDNDKLIKSYDIEPNRWHLLQVNVTHSVIGIDPGKKRWGISTQLLHGIENESA